MAVEPDKKKYPMFGASVMLTLNQLVEHIVPEITVGTNSQKMTRYEVVYDLLNKLTSGLGTAVDPVPPEWWYVTVSAMERAQRLHHSLVERTDVGHVEKKVQDQVANSVDKYFEHLESCGPEEQDNEYVERVFEAAVKAVRGNDAFEEVRRLEDKRDE